MQEQPIPDWNSDWLYSLIFKEAEEYWSWCLRSDTQHFVLIEEWSSDDSAQCTGSVIRAWVRDERGINEISLQEHEAHISRIRNRDPFAIVYPFIRFEFHIQPNRDYVVLGFQADQRFGRGGRYAVIGDMNKATLEPNGGGWIS